MARAFVGEVVAFGATPASALAAKVAKLVHNSDLVLLGGSSMAAVDSDPLPEGRDDEAAALASSQGSYEWSEVFALIASGHYLNFIGPVQIDRWGAANLSVIGDWAKPHVQLIGSRGLPDDLWLLERMNYHVPRHSPRSVVERVDFASTIGYGRARQQAGARAGLPGLLVTDLGVFTWDPDAGMRVETLHAGVHPTEVRAATGFALDLPARPRVTEAPNDDELGALEYLTGASVDLPSQS